MIFRILGCGAALLLASCEVHFDGEESEAVASICAPVMFEQSPFTHCTADPAEHVVGTALAPEGGSPWRSLRAFSQDDTASQGAMMAMNAGMYDSDGQPIGYFVENGQRLHLLNRAEGPGNFHLLPNGVFFGTTDGSWRVLPTDAFAEQVTERPMFATQSGPMLVIDGELHPSFDPDGESRKIRNGVGVDANGRAHFLISEAPVSFGKMARLYRDVLNVDNALFLDGTVSLLWDASRGRIDTGAPIGPLVVVRRQEDVE
ncbi:phosphodiester glycosidase family protein [Aurantiacibacter arachoides]|uniref:phosphodiester glycosidase family protein n=1 Tax=Aurantiacibacter arachoides TaxID=1850444 RepID=UPI0019B9AA81|nr:phosphodiester glycosidase family protein [Aurantiacibacter arachoides]GGD52007.1 lipoprotein signal peptide [Aurantiacibacter arachoides]